MTESQALESVRTEVAKVQVSVATLTERIDRLLESRDGDRAARAQLEERVAALTQQVDQLQTRADHLEGAIGVLHWLGGLAGVAGGGGGAAGLYALWQSLPGGGP